MLTIRHQKRRAQVREAQRSYQKRKDTATATERRRADDLLQVLSDLSADVEALLQAASKAGTMYHDDDVSKRIQSLWQTYDTAINSDCVKPELRLQQIKNDQRQAQHKADGNFVVMSPTGGAATENDPLSFRRKVVPFNPEGINFDLTPTDNNDNNVVQCMMVLGDNRSVKGRSIFNIAKERQAALKAADYTHRELSVQFIAPTMEN